MSAEIAFVGDVHGNLSALRGLHDALVAIEAVHVVFLGDYINKGAQSAEVIDHLISYARSGGVTLLRGNHEASLLDALHTGDLAPFLKIGGAVTIRSYVGPVVGPDVLSDFKASLPPEHLDIIRRMPRVYESEKFIAQHILPAPSTARFRIGAHVPVGPLPRISNRSAQLDTGCGAGAGRLTAMLWPSLGYIQVEANGTIASL